MNKPFDLKSIQSGTICLGSHPGIIQSMLDYNYCLGHERPNIIAIVSGGRKQERYFWGHDEIVVPVYAKLAAVPIKHREQAAGLLNVQSARRVLTGMKEAF